MKTPEQFKGEDRNFASKNNLRALDVQMKSIDNKTYKKYFSMCREKSKWSEKNKALAGSLEERGLMTDFGRKKIEEAKKNGQWDAQNSNIKDNPVVAVSGEWFTAHGKGVSLG